VLNEDAIRQLAIGQDYLRTALARELTEIDRRRRTYLGGRAPAAMRGRTVIVVDDGIATGGTMKAALKGARKNGVARLVLAVPVAPREALTEFRAECDDLICLTTPEPFGAVGFSYADFRQTTDEEVIALLADAASTRRQGAGPLAESS